MTSQSRPGSGAVKSLMAWLVLGPLVLFALSSQAATDETAADSAPSEAITPEPEVSIWVDAAPLRLVINQLAQLSGRTAQIEGLAEVLVSGRYSASFGKTLAMLSADYPVIFDLDGSILRATDSGARSSVSIAMLSTDLDEKLKNELLASSADSGNNVEFREDAVRVTGHPEFVKRQARLITRALATAGARLKNDTLAEASEPAENAPAPATAPATATATATDVTAIADSGTAEVVADMQGEGKPPADQASLSRPIRWVTDIPGFNTF